MDHRAPSSPSDWTRENPRGDLGARSAQPRVHHKRRRRVYVAFEESVSAKPIPSETFGNGGYNPFGIIRDIDPQWEEDSSWVVEYIGKPGSQYEGRKSTTRRLMLQEAVEHVTETTTALQYWDATIKNLLTNEEVPVEILALG